MTKRTKENLGFLILGGALSFLFCEWTILERGTQIEQQAEIIDAYDQYWHSIEDQDMLQIADRFDYEDSLAINYDEAREKLYSIMENLRNQDIPDEEIKKIFTTVIKDI